MLALPDTPVGYSPVCTSTTPQSYSIIIYLTAEIYVIIQDAYFNNSNNIREIMSCNARGRCHFCYKKHTISVFGSDEMTHKFLQKMNLKLGVLNTVCSPCITELEDFLKRNFPDIHSPFEKTIIKKNHIGTLTGFQNTNNLEINTEKSQVDNNIKTEKITETDIKIEEKVNSIDIENKASTHSSQVREDTRNIRKKQLICEFCQKEFNHTGDFNKHRRKHTGEQPYTCNTCGRKFKTSSNLGRHQQVHLGIKPFCCKICGRSYTRQIKLSAHLITKHYEALKSD
ncbi:zinc finger protein 266 [Monomorium pharaonis]|uniref:zinc finger protein 266 n=1 Tax=Monomorium pharaonis TaxID=307658 RepID=UPI00063FA095|nr:zinc finger protein 266 [Monomorium pharaonis]